MVSQEGVFCYGVAKICKFTDDLKTIKYFQYQTNNYRYYQDTFVKCVTTVSMSVQCNYTHVTVCVEQQEVYVVAEGLNVTDKATSSNVLV